MEIEKTSDKTKEIKVSEDYCNSNILRNNIYDFVKDITDNPVEYIQNEFDAYIKNKSLTKDLIDNFNPLLNKLEIDFKLKKNSFAKDILSLSNIKCVSNYISNNIDHKDNTIYNYDSYQPILSKLTCYINFVKESNIYVSCIKNPKTNNTLNCKFIENLEDNKEFKDFNNIDQEDIFNNENCILKERLTIYVKPIKELQNIYNNNENNCFCKYFSLKEYNIVVYDYTNKFTKVNTAITIIGLSYINNKNKTIIIHAFYIEELLSLKNIFDISNTSIDNLLDTSNSRNNNDKNDNSKIDSLFNFDFKSIKKNILNDLNYIIHKDINANDSSIEYLIHSLLSTITIRKDDTLVGYIAINMLGFNDYNQVEKLKKYISNIYPIILDYTLSVDNLNNSNIIPTFNNDTETLSDSQFQLPNHSLILIDEYNISNGKLTEKGVKNLNFINNIILNQELIFNFPYQPEIKIQINCPVILLSKTKSILISMNEKIIPVKINKDINNINNNNNKDTKENDFAITNIKEKQLYFMFSKEILFNQNEINEDLSDTLKKDFVETRKTSKSLDDFTPEDFKLNLNLSKIFSASLGYNNFNYEHYLYVKDHENKRKLLLNKK